MREDTRQALLAVNKRFYDEYSSSFGSTREKPWDAWAPLLEEVKEPALEPPIRILDVGCGNGRFGATAADVLGVPIVYHGLDQSDGLLEQASTKLRGRVAELLLEPVDLGQPFQWRPDQGNYDLITLFGVLHHLPGELQRRNLLKALAQRLGDGRPPKKARRNAAQPDSHRPKGRLWASWWMLHRTDRYAKKQLPWQQLQEVDPKSPLDVDDLEPGDALLSWRRDGMGLRYLHFPADDELERLKSLPGAHFQRLLESDGPTGGENLYLSWTC